MSRGHDLGLRWFDPADYDGWEDAPPEHRLVTAGLASQVFGTDGEELGHVVMLDLDGVDRIGAVRQAEALDGPAVALRSSTGNHLVIGLRPVPWEEALDAARRSRSCSDYVEEMAERGRFIMRTHPKLHQLDGEEYRATPVPFYVSDGDGAVSGPHDLRLRQLAEEVGAEHVATWLRRTVRSCSRVGETLTQSRYETMTDELREAVGPAEEVEERG